MTENVLQEAEKIINGQRRLDYGGVTESFDLIADLWGGYLRTDLTGHDVANLMILLKVARAKNGFHRDSYVDIAGYAGCAEKLTDEAAGDEDLPGEEPMDYALADIPYMTTYPNPYLPLIDLDDDSLEIDVNLWHDYDPETTLIEEFFPEGVDQAEEYTDEELDQLYPPFDADSVSTTGSFIPRVWTSCRDIPEGVRAGDKNGDRWWGASWRQETWAEEHVEKMDAEYGPWLELKPLEHV